MSSAPRWQSECIFHFSLPCSLPVNSPDATPSSTFRACNAVLSLYTAGAWCVASTGAASSPSVPTSRPSTRAPCRPVTRADHAGTRCTAINTHWSSRSTRPLLRARMCAGARSRSSAWATLCLTGLPSTRTSCCFRRDSARTGCTGARTGAAAGMGRVTHARSARKRSHYVSEIEGDGERPIFRVSRIQPGTCKCYAHRL